MRRAGLGDLRNFEEPAGTPLGWIAVCTRLGAVELMWIEAKGGREKTRGDRMLRELCKLADKKGVDLTLQAAPWNEEKLDSLIGWYERNGFVLDSPPRNQSRHQRMTRKPKTKNE
jgi:hypothetical protein